MKYFYALFLMTALVGCTDAQMAKNTAYGTKFKVTLWSGGDAVKTWTSTGKVETESQSDGWYFTDDVNKKLVRVSGSVTIEAL